MKEDREVLNITARNEDNNGTMSLRGSSVLRELFSKKALLIAVSTSVFLVFVAFVYRAHQQERLPTPYFQGTPEKLAGVAELHQLPRGRVLVRVIDDGEHAMYFDCLPIRSVCDGFSPGERLGRVELTAFRIDGSVYWPHSLSIDGRLVLPSDRSLVAYDEYRNREIDFYLVLMKIALFLGAYAAAIYTAIWLNRRQAQRP